MGRGLERERKKINIKIWKILKTVPTRVFNIVTSILKFDHDRSRVGLLLIVGMNTYAPRRAFTFDWVLSGKQSTEGLHIDSYVFDRLVVCSNRTINFEQSIRRTRPS